MILKPQPLKKWLGLPRRPGARIEPVDASCAEILAALHSETFARGWSAQEFERMLSDRNIVSDGLFIGRKINPFGFILSRRVLDEAEILSVVIDSTVRGQGFSHPLLKRHLEALLHFGIRNVHLEVDENNGPALALYRSAGFSETGRRKGYYSNADGSLSSALTMSLRL